MKKLKELKMRKPVEKESFLNTMINLVKMIQIGSTLLLIILTLSTNLSMITYNGYPVSLLVTLSVLIIQCLLSLLLLRSLAKSVLRRKAWLIWLTSWALGHISIVSFGAQASINSNLSIFGAPLAITSFILIIASHSYIKKVRTVWDR
jgi:predicted neutral ceramidase superfamily lipid hydrolase